MHQKSNLPIFEFANLNDLTHKKIDEAFANILLKSPFFQNPDLIRHNSSLYQAYTEEKLISPYKRLEDLVDRRYKSEKHYILGLRIVGNLLGASNEESLQLNQDNAFVNAIRIFSKFKIEGNQYTSENGNSCLHDAIVFCGGYSDSLTSLLIQNGANPELTNDNNQMAITLYIQHHLPQSIDEYIEKVIKFSPPHKQMKLILVHVLENQSDSLVLEYLKIVQLYNPIDTYPEIFNNLSLIDNEPKTILHKAVTHQSLKIVKALLQLGANPDVMDACNLKAIHYAAIRATIVKSKHEADEALNIVLLLMMSSLKKSMPHDEMPTADSIINALMELELSKEGLRLRACMLLSQGMTSKEYTYTQLRSKLQAKLSLLAHKEIHSIEINNFLGKGSHGAVFKATRQHSQDGVSNVAIKLNLSPFDGPHFRSEGKLLSSLKHPNIIKFICHLERPNICGFVMQYANQGSLGNFIIDNKSTVLTFDYLISLMKQINSGLHYLHKRNYVHLDLTLANILMHNFMPLIADFGTTALEGETRPDNVTNITVCSPERFNPKIPFSRPNDIFSLGVCYGGIVTGQHPFDEAIRVIPDKEELASFIQNRVENYFRTSFNNQPIPPAFRQLINKCCEQSPNLRPTCEEIDTDLDQLSYIYGSQCK